MRKKYPSDITRKQFQKIRPLLEKARKKTRPRTLDLYDVFCGVLYVLKSGCQWRMLPSDFPKWRSVHSYFAIWSEEKEGQESILDQALKKNSWKGPYRQWSERENNLLYRGRTKREKHGYGGRERL
jgi:transposase